MSPLGPYRKAPSTPKTLAERLLATRLAWGWTQAEFAKALNTNQRTVSSWERDTHSPSPAVQAAIAQLFKMDLDVLLGPDFSLPDHPNAFSRHTERGAAERDWQELPLPIPPEGAAAVKLDRRGKVSEALGGKAALALLREAIRSKRNIWIILE